MHTSASKQLRDLLRQPGPLICPGVIAPIFAILAEAAGFESIYATGAGISNANLGLPDLGLMDMSEMLQVTQNIVQSVSKPVIADIDTGYGNALNVTRTIQSFIRAGVGGVQIEDQINPKRCGHFEDKTVVSSQEMVERLIAAVEARDGHDLVLIARTDALAPEGLSAAIERAHLYVQAGADVIFIEAPTSVDQLRTIGREFSVPLVVNMVEGGKTPMLSAEALTEMGFKVILYANAVLRMAMAASRRALREIRETGTTEGILAEMDSWESRQGAVKLDAWLDIDKNVRGKAQVVFGASSNQYDRGPSDA